MTLAAPDLEQGGAQWRALAAVVVLQAFTIGFAVYSYTLWVTPLMETFAVGRGPILLGAGIDGLMMAAMSPIAGYAIDRVSPRRLLLAGLGAFALGVLLVSTVGALWQLWLIYGTLIPFGAGCAGPVACQAFVARSFVRRRGLALGISSAGTALGGLVLPPLIAQLIGEIGWRGTHAVLATGTFLLIAPAVWFWVPDARPPAAARSGSELGDYGRMLGIGRLWIIIAAFLPIGIVFSSVQFNLGPIARDRAMSLETAGFLLSALAISMITGKLLFGSLADRIGHRILYFVDIVCLVIAVGLISVDQTAGGLFGGVIFLGLAGGGFYPLISAIVASSFTSAQFGRALGVCFLFLNASLVGPSVIARVRDATGGYASALQTMLLLLVPAAIVILFLNEKKPASRTPLGTAGPRPRQAI